MAGSASEQELALARRPGLYLVLDLEHGRLLVKARGMELDQAPVTDARLVVPAAAEGGASVDLPKLPAVWRVAHPPSENWRQVVAPPTLVPYREDEEPPLSSASASSEPPPPAQYRVELDNGWTLAVGSSPPTRLGRRLLARLRSGWDRLRGRPAVTRPPMLVVQTSADNARRLVHVFRPGLAILLTDH